MAQHHQEDDAEASLGGKNARAVAQNSPKKVAGSSGNDREDHGRRGVNTFPSERLGVVPEVFCENLPEKRALQTLRQNAYDLLPPSGVLASGDKLRISRKIRQS